LVYLEYALSIDLPLHYLHNTQTAPWRGARLGSPGEDRQPSEICFADARRLRKTQQSASIVQHYSFRRREQCRIYCCCHCCSLPKTIQSLQYMMAIINTSRSTLGFYPSPFLQHNFLTDPTNRLSPKHVPPISNSATSTALSL